MSFYDHFDELRGKLLRCLMVFCAGFVVFYFASDPLLEILKKPLFDAMPADQRKLYFTHLFENFMTHLKIGGYASLFFLSPIYFHQIWSFIAPGLLPRERKLVVPFVLSSTVFFIGGACFAYFVLFPVGFKYFISYGSATDVPLLTMDSYYSTCLKLLLLFGVAFELSILIFFLGLLGVIDADMLRAHRRNAVLGISVFSALFAPPDAISMLILGGPLVLLYELAIWAVHWFGPSRRWGAATNSETAITPVEPPHPFEGRSRK